MFLPSRLKKNPPVHSMKKCRFTAKPRGLTMICRLGWVFLFLFCSVLLFSSQSQNDLDPESPVTPKRSRLKAHFLFFWGFFYPEVVLWATSFQQTKKDVCVGHCGFATSAKRSPQLHKNKIK